MRYAKIRFSRISDVEEIRILSSHDQNYKKGPVNNLPFYQLGVWIAIDELIACLATVLSLLGILRPNLSKYTILES